MESKKIGVRYDSWLLVSVFALVLFGAIMVYSSSTIYANERFGDQYFFIKKHLVFLLCGVGAFVIGMKINQNFIKKMVVPLLVVSVASLIFVIVSNRFVHKSGAASRWITIASLSFQPSEIAKIGLILFLANYISRIGDEIKSFKKGFLPCVLVSGLYIALVLKQPDFGTAMTMSLIVFIMLFVAGTRLTYLAGSLLIFVPPLVFLFLTSGYRLKRILTFLDPWKDPLGSGFQVIQSFIAFANGGLFGAGLGAGKQKLLYLPEAHTDFIFSVVGEELGLIGVSLVVVLFGIFLVKGFSVALKLRDSFAVMLSVGITTMIGLQAFTNMGVTLGILPTKGLTLPFISYGGSSLVVCMFASGLLVNLSAKMNQVPSFKIPGGA